MKNKYIKYFIFLLPFFVLSFISISAFTYTFTFKENKFSEYSDISVEAKCLAENVYFEARNESKLGKQAVAWVTLNRVKSESYPNTVCEVVYQAKTIPHWKTKEPVPVLFQCQFSWFCDGKPDLILNEEKFFESYDLSLDVMKNYFYKKDPTYGATMFHADYVNPDWTKHYVRTVQIDSHIFYKPK